MSPGKFLNIRACDLLGGALREEVPFASYLFYRYRDKKTGAGGEITPDEMVAHARDLARRYGFKTHKLKGGLFPPDHDVEVFRALGAAFPEASLRLDPNSVWCVEEGIRVGQGDRAISTTTISRTRPGGSKACARLRQLGEHPDRDQHGGGQFRAARRLHPHSRRST